MKQAKQMPGKLNGILRLHFCVWTDAETAWISREVLEPALQEFDPADYHGHQIGMGVDLSQTQDLSAKACATIIGQKDVEEEHDGHKVTVKKPIIAAWIEAWTPGDTVPARQLRDKAPYDVWIRDGHLKAPKGKIVSYRHIAAAIARDAGLFEVLALGYDRYAYKSNLEPELIDLGCEIEQVEHPQGGKKKGKPTEAMKAAAKEAGTEAEGLWMPASVKLVEEMLLEGRLILQNNPVLVSAMMSAVTQDDPWGNYWLSKERATNKIDAAVALCMAVGVLMSMPNATSVDDWIASLR